MISTPTTGRQFAEAMDAIWNRFCFRAGEAATLGEGRVSVLVAGEQIDERTCRALITLAAGLVPPPLVQGLPWGVVDTEGRVVAAGRTDERGQFVVDLAGGQYRLRYVLDVQQPVDLDILQQLNDEQARSFLEDRADDERVPVELRGKICTAVSDRETVLGKLLKIALAATDEVREETIPASVLRYVGHMGETFDPASTAGLAHTGPREWPAEAHLGRPEIAGQFVRMMCMRDEAPYGIGRLYTFQRNPDGETLTPVGTCLLPMPLYESATQRYRLGQTTLVAVTGCTLSHPKIVPYFVPAHETTFDQFPRTEVQRLRQTPAVAADEELAARLDELLDRLNE